jgi:hypothetical protein
MGLFWANNRFTRNVIKAGVPVAGWRILAVARKGSNLKHQSKTRNPSPRQDLVICNTGARYKHYLVFIYFIDYKPLVKYEKVEMRFLLQLSQFLISFFKMKAPDKNIEVTADASYPLYDLAEAAKIAEAVRDLGGGKEPVSKSLLAKQLKYAESGPSFYQRVTATKAFGLIDGRGSYSLTDLGKQYFYPTTENGKESASVKSLTNPRAFGVLVQKFDGGKLPTIEMMGNIIHAEAGVPVSKKSTVAGTFLRSVQFIGALDSGGFLRCRALVLAGKKVLDGIDSGTIPKEFNLDNAPEGVGSHIQNSKPENAQEEPGYHTYVLPLSNGRKITVKAPLDVTKSEIERLKKWEEFTLFLDWKGDDAQ